MKPLELDEKRDERGRCAGRDQLVRSARNGDLRAFDELVRAHYARIYACAFRLVGNHEDAEDLAQDCFVKAHRALRRYRGEGDFGAWLRRILVHLVRDRFRFEARRPAHTSILAGLEPSAGLAPPAELGAREFSRLFDAALRRLPDRLRIPLILRVLEGLDYPSISRATGVTPGTARTQVMKARRALRGLLASHLRERGREGGR